MILEAGCNFLFEFFQMGKDSKKSKKDKKSKEKKEGERKKVDKDDKGGDVEDYYLATVVIDDDFEGAPDYNIYDEMSKMDVNDEKKNNLWASVLGEENMLGHIDEKFCHQKLCEAMSSIEKGMEIQAQGWRLLNNVCSAAPSLSKFVGLITDLSDAKGKIVEQKLRLKGGVRKERKLEQEKLERQKTEGRKKGEETVKNPDGKKSASSATVSKNPESVEMLIKKEVTEDELLQDLDVDPILIGEGLEQYLHRFKLDPKYVLHYDDSRGKRVYGCASCNVKKGSYGGVDSHVREAHIEMKIHCFCRSYATFSFDAFRKHVLKHQKEQIERQQNLLKGVLAGKSTKELVADFTQSTISGKLDDDGKFHRHCLEKEKRVKIDVHEGDVLKGVKERESESERKVQERKQREKDDCSKSAEDTQTGECDAAKKLEGDEVDRREKEETDEKFDKKVKKPVEKVLNEEEVEKEDVKEEEKKSKEGKGDNKREKEEKDVKADKKKSKEGKGDNKGEKEENEEKDVKADKKNLNEGKGDKMRGKAENEKMDVDADKEVKVDTMKAKEGNERKGEVVDAGKNKLKMIEEGKRQEKKKEAGAIVKKAGNEDVSGVLDVSDSTLSGFSGSSDEDEQEKANTFSGFSASSDEDKQEKANVSKRKISTRSREGVAKKKQRMK